ncbi:MAG: CoA transferase [Caulobacteraceae bacterium]|nr:CoA transferase [Caulobacteraceae bacterium]
MYDLLNGLRVVEASAFVAGPSCGLHLAQLGAEVIRVDQIGGGPDFGRWPLAPETGASLYWEGLNKAKKSVAIDLGRPEGRELLVALATAPGDDAGLFVTNFPVAGFLAYERLAARRSDLVCVRIMGWPDGRPALDYTVNAAIGLPMTTGPVGDDRPVNHVLPAWDLLTGAYAAFCLVSAERDRRLTGRGREVRLPLSDIAIAALANLGQIGEVGVRGADRPRMGNEIYGAFGRDFVTRDGRRLMVVAITPRQWSGLLAVLGLTEGVAALEGELGVSFARDEGVRFEHRERLMPMVEAAIAAREAAQLAEAFEARSVCWSTYQSLTEAVARDPYFGPANPILEELDHPSGRRYLAPGFAATLPADERRRPSPAPALGRDTDEVLSRVLGLPAREIARLHDAGVVAGPRPTRA